MPRTRFLATCFRAPPEASSGPVVFGIRSGVNGGRDRDRTCDPYDVNVVLSR